MKSSDSMTAQEIGRRIAQARKAINKSQATLGAEIGISRQQMIEIEKGRVKIDLMLVEQIAKSVGVTKESLIGSKPSKSLGSLDDKIHVELQAVLDSRSDAAAALQTVISVFYGHLSSARIRSRD